MTMLFATRTAPEEITEVWNQFKKDPGRKELRNRLQDKLRTFFRRYEGARPASARRSWRKVRHCGRGPSET